MSFSVVGRSVIVTGGSRGIGYGIAEVFAEAGARVAIVGRDSDVAVRAATSLGEHGASVDYLIADISKPSECARMADEAITRHGGIDILCANAGIFITRNLSDMTEEEYDETLDINMKGCLFSVQACLPALAASGHGRVIVTSSITGPMTGMPGRTHYGASKAAQLGFVRAAAIELAPQGITVNAVLPGTILSEGMVKSGKDLDKSAASIPLKRTGSPRDVGYATLFLASDEAAYITGQTLVIDGGLTLIE